MIPGRLSSDEPTDLSTLDEDAFRFDSEETFLDEKSGGFQLESSELACPQALERLMLIVALATVHFRSHSLFVVRAQLRRWVDTHWDRGLRYFKIGWRWLRQHYRRQWPSLGSCALGMKFVKFVSHHTGDQQQISSMRLKSGSYISSTDL